MKMLIRSLWISGLLLIVAQDGWSLEIVEPVEGARQEAGSTVRVVVKSISNENWRAITLGFRVLPYDVVSGTYRGEFSVKTDAKLGPVTLKVLAVDSTGNEIELTRQVTIVLPPNVTLQGLRVDPKPPIFLEFDPDMADKVIIGQVKRFVMIGQFSDGIERDLPLSEVTAIVQDPTIASIEPGGKIKAKKVGKTTLVVKSGSREINVPLKVDRCVPDLTCGVEDPAP